MTSGVPQSNGSKYNKAPDNCGGFIGQTNLIIVVLILPVDYPSSVVFTYFVESPVRLVAAVVVRPYCQT